MIFLLILVLGVLIGVGFAALVRNERASHRGAVTAEVIDSGTVAELENEVEHLEKEIEEERALLRTCEWENPASTLAEINARLRALMEQRKRTILSALRERGDAGLTSADVAGMIGLSRRSARRYLGELVEDGNVKQTAVSGATTRYLFIRSSVG